MGLNSTAQPGVLRAGNSSLAPFPHTATIQLNGNRASPMLTIDADRDVGSKAILVLGELLLFGKPRFPAVSHVHLVQVAAGGATEISVDQVSFLGDAKSSLGDVKSSLGDAKSSLGDV